ncbi:ribonuclease III [Streptococcus pneumoniae GA11663]|nr:ribonuclease III [Streptococcus pneumoniae GA11663]
MKKYDFQKPSKIPYLETTGMPTRILLRKRRFKCYHCSKMMVAETPLVKKITKSLVSSTKKLLKS